MKPHIKQLGAVRLANITDLRHGSLGLSPLTPFLSTHRKHGHNRTDSIHKPTQSHLAPISAEPRLLCRFHLLLFESVITVSRRQKHTPAKSSCRMKKHSLMRPWTHRITPHSRFHPRCIRSKQNASTAQPRTRLLFGDCWMFLCAGWVDVGGRCVYVYRLLMILLFSTFSILCPFFITTSILLFLTPELLWLLNI